MADTERRELKCLVLPMLHGPGVLVPASLVAEIVTQQEVSDPPGSADWLLGMGAWRGTEIPLVSFERLSGVAPAEPLEASGRYVVLFSLEPDQAPAYYGLAIRALPRSETIDAERLEGRERAPDDAEVIALRGRLGDRECVVPDLDALVRAVRGEMGGGAAA